MESFTILGKFILNSLNRFRMYFPVLEAEVEDLQDNVTTKAANGSMRL